MLCLLLHCVTLFVVCNQTRPSLEYVVPLSQMLQQQFVTLPILARAILWQHVVDITWSRSTKMSATALTALSMSLSIATLHVVTTGMILCVCTMWLLWNRQQSHRVFSAMIVAIVACTQCLDVAVCTAFVHIVLSKVASHRHKIKSK